MMATLLNLVLAALLEVGGDAAIRRGLVRSAPGWIVLGGSALVAYGLAVNLSRTLEFGRLMGTYIAVFFLVSQVIGLAVFREAPSTALVIGGILIGLGGLVIQLGAR